MGMIHDKVCDRQGGISGRWAWVVRESSCLALGETVKLSTLSEHPTKLAVAVAVEWWKNVEGEGTSLGPR